MGAALSAVTRLFSSTPPWVILMVGPPNAGKTTIMYKLKLGEVVSSPTEWGPHIALPNTRPPQKETATHKSTTFISFDLNREALDASKNPVTQKPPGECALLFGPASDRRWVALSGAIASPNHSPKTPRICACVWHTGH